MTRENVAVELSQEELSFPPLSDDLRELILPVREVTLLEDRAQVRRAGRVSLEPGRNRLLVRDVAPVLQDVSLRGEVVAEPDQGRGPFRLTDVRVRRAMRVRTSEKPGLAGELEGQIEAVERRFEEVGEDREHSAQRYDVVVEMLEKGAREIPQDAAWGLVNHQVWHDTFETLCKRARQLLQHNVEGYLDQLDLMDELERLTAARYALDRWDTEFVAWIEADIEAEAAGEAEVRIEYVVPNALWRPFHAATLLDDGRLRFRSAAAVWQNTGEDWKEAQLFFSTARSSLGTEPPRLNDDLLQAQRKDERIVVEQRQVAIQSTGPGREKSGPRARPSGALDLPGVDDGGDVQNLRARGPSTIPSDGRLNVIPVFEFEAEAERTLISVPELEQKVFLKATASNRGPHPILAGPVELIREGGVTGWTKCLFVSPGERFELSFGHDDGMRVYRTSKTEAETDPVDQWTRRSNRITLYLSNLEGRDKDLEVVERIPRSEIEHVKVRLLEDECEPELPELDDQGFCRWNLTIPANDRTALKLVWELATAPDVEGL